MWARLGAGKAEALEEDHVIDHKQHLISVGITEPYRLGTREESFGEIQIHRAVRVICVDRQSDQCEDCEQKCAEKHDYIH